MGQGSRRIQVNEQAVLPLLMAVPCEKTSASVNTNCFSVGEWCGVTGASRHAIEAEHRHDPDGRSGLWRYRKLWCSRCKDSEHRSYCQRGCEAHRLLCKCIELFADTSGIHNWTISAACRHRMAARRRRW